MRLSQPTVALVVLATLMSATTVRAETPAVEFQSEPGQIVVTAGGKPVATYVYSDPKTPRPYFAHLHAVGGPQLTRNHPPHPDDAQDHDVLHPGMWFALGDLSGSDNWRLKARVAGGEFVTKPSSDAKEGGFTVRNQYLANDGKQTLCTEDCRYRFVPRPWGCLLIADSTLTARMDGCRFGDQMEEMGLGVRMATPLVVNAKKGGQILDSEGRINEQDVREKLADWCDLNGKLGGQKAGITLMADPQNPRKTWWHARNYGFAAANLFHAHPSRTENMPIGLNAGQSLRIQYGIALHRDQDGTTYDPAEVFKEFVSLAKR